MSRKGGSAADVLGHALARLEKDGLPSRIHKASERREHRKDAQAASSVRRQDDWDIQERHNQEGPTQKPKRRADGY